MAGSTWRLLPAQARRRILSPGAAVAHIGVALVGSTILVLANAIGSPSAIWFWRPLLILGALVVLHAIAIMAAGRTSRLRVVAAWASAVAMHLLATWSAWASDTLRPALRSWWRRWEQLVRPEPIPADQPAPAPITTASTAWPDPVPSGAASGSWAAPPAAPAVTSLQPATSWPERPPAWAASWPTPPAAAALPPLPPLPPIRPTGYDTVLNGAQMADPDNPRWDQLEVAASMWLAHRDGDAPAEAVP